MRVKKPGFELKREMQVDRAMVKRLFRVVTAVLALSLASLSCTPSAAPTSIAELEAMIYQLETEQTALATAEGKLSQREVRIAELEAMISQLGTEQMALATVEGKLSQREVRIAELEAMISQLDTEKTPQTTWESEYSQEIVDQARAVGIEARKSVVFIEIIREDGFGHATAWFLERGLLLTAGHNVEGAVTIKGYMIDGDTFSVEVINGSHIPVDVAVLRTDYTKAPALPVGSSERLKEGDPLVQVGHPGEFGNWVITLGEFVRRRNNGTLVGTVPGGGGVSGSPVLNLDGEVVGLTTGRSFEPVGGGVIGPPTPGAPPSNSEIYQSLEELESLKELGNVFSNHGSIEFVLEQVAEWTE